MYIEFKSVGDRYDFSLLHVADSILSDLVQEKKNP